MRGQDSSMMADLKRRRPPGEADRFRKLRVQDPFVQHGTSQDSHTARSVADSEASLFVEDLVSDAAAYSGPTTPQTPRPHFGVGARRASCSPQRLQKTGFAEPRQHPARQSPYRRPRFKNPQNQQSPLPPISATVAGPEPQHESDMDEGAAGISSDSENEDSMILRRLAPRADTSRISASKNDNDTSAFEARLHTKRSDKTRSLLSFDGSVVPDSQPDSQPQTREVVDFTEPPVDTDAKKQTPTGSEFLPVDSVFNTTTEAPTILSAPSNLTGSTQESDSASRDRFIQWLKCQESSAVHVLSDFLAKRCGFTTETVPAQYYKLREALATYVVSQKSLIDGPRMMQGRHKELASDSTQSMEKFFNRVLYEMRMRQKNAQVETEIIYGPWYELVEIVGRPMVAFILLYTSVYRPAGDAQWFQIAGDVPKYLPNTRSLQSSPFQRQPPFVTKSDIVFRELHSSSRLVLPPMTPAMELMFPTELKVMIKTVEKRARPMKFCFSHVRVNKNGWTPRKNVANFLSLCIKKLFPRAMLGSASNHHALSYTIRRFVNMSASAKMLLGQTAHKIKLNAIPWTHKIPKDDKSEHLLEVMSLFWEWIFNHFVKPMLAHHFYMTEMSGLKTSLYYYELSAWSRKVKTPGLKAFIDQQGGLERLIPGNSGERIRCVPKKSGGVRTIINLKNFNQTLQYAHAVLQAMPRSKTRLESWQSWFLPLYTFQELHNPPPGGKFYSVKLDISGCYDNMNKHKLEQIVRNHLAGGETEFWLQTHAVYDSCRNFIRNQTMATNAAELYEAAESNKLTLPIDQGRRCDQPPLILFSKVTGNLQLHGSLLPPEKRMLHGTPYSGQEVLDDLSRLTNNLKIQTHHNQMISFEAGIPQGSSCSLDLCNLLLDDLVHTHLHKFIEDPQCLLLRYVDDFLFVSTSRELAEEYQALMLNGFSEEYGVICKPEKQQTNLGPKKVKMDYLGYEFDPDTLEIFPRNINQAGSTAPVATHKSLLVQRMHLNFESILGILRAYRRSGVPAPATLEKKVSRAFGRFVADSFEACCKFIHERNPHVVFHKLVRIKLLPLVGIEQRTAMLNVARHMFLIRIQRKISLTKSAPHNS